MLKRYVYGFLLFCAGCSSGNRQPERKLPERPNIVVIMTDQERYPAHWPKGWAEMNLPSTMRLKKHGLTFHRAYTAACECTPSRAVMFTSQYSPTNKMTQTGPKGSGLPTFKQLVDIGSLLSGQAGYEVVWKGKWHLTPPLNSHEDWTEQDIANMQSRYDLTQWNPPDAGNAILEFQPLAGGGQFSGLATLGGGYADNDGRFVQGVSKNFPKQTQGLGESILDYLYKVKATPKEQRKPFCLFVSLVNPHDVWVYPKSWEKAGYHKEDFESLGIGLPFNYKDDLSTKPSVQRKAKDAYQALAPLTDEQSLREYVNFYAYLHKVVDGHIETVLNALEEADLLENTIIIRTADHGELGLSHGMREKSYTAYEEMIHIPLIISNPLLFPTAQETSAFYCHLDLMPTLAELTGIKNPNSYGKGFSLAPVLKEPSSSVQDSILFAFDDVFFLPVDVAGGHIRALREGDWTYAVYYSEDGSHVEYEMYNLKQDPGQLHNLLYGEVKPEVKKEAGRLHAKLRAKINDSDALPQGVPFPSP